MQASAGPVGRSTQAETDAAMSAEILTYSRSKGLFAGMAITGATLRPDDDWNKELYGSALKNRDIVTGNTAPPAAAADLLAALNKYSPRK
jgi:lipid-binding SYLF domain-containing protein